MIKNVWKFYISQLLNDFENDELDEHDDDSGTEKSRADTTDANNDNNQWCKTLRRSFAYTFESFCKLVISSAIKHALIRNKCVITPSDIEDSIQRLFKIDTAPTRPRTHHKHRSPSKFIKWSTTNNYNQKLLQHRYRGNLSISRKLLRVKVNSTKGDCELVCRDLNLERYKIIKPVNNIEKMKLSDVFEL